METPTTITIDLNEFQLKELSHLTPKQLSQAVGSFDDDLNFVLSYPPITIGSVQDIEELKNYLGTNVKDARIEVDDENNIVVRFVDDLVHEDEN